MNRHSPRERVRERESRQTHTTNRTLAYLNERGFFINGTRNPSLSESQNDINATAFEAFWLKRPPAKKKLLLKTKRAPLGGNFFCLNQEKERKYWRILAPVWRVFGSQNGCSILFLFDSFMKKWLCGHVFRLYCLIWSAWRLLYFYFFIFLGINYFQHPLVWFDVDITSPCIIAFHNNLRHILYIYFSLNNSKLFMHYA
jgi:hypothetical protein